jgi:hypothetical protein
MINDVANDVVALIFVLITWEGLPEQICTKNCLRIVVFSFLWATVIFLRL